MRVLAIDPGYDRCGIAVIEKLPTDRREKLVFSTCVETSKSLAHAERLTAIGRAIESIITEHSPTALAIETLFFNANRTTGIKVAEARGIALYCGTKAGLEVMEYSPQEIKLAVTGDGRSDKTGIMRMVPRLIDISTPVKRDDEYDAIAIGLAFFAYQAHRARSKK